MGKSEEEVGFPSHFGGSVASNEQELVIDEGVPGVDVVPNLDVVINEGEECVRRALEEPEASDSRTEEASDGDSFVDTVGNLERETGVDSEGFTFADILQRADLPETVFEGVVDSANLPSC